MLANKVHGENVKQVEFSLAFHWEHNPDSGFSFTCDESGALPENYFDDRPHALENYQFCQRGYDDRGLKIISDGIRRYEWSYWEPAHGECACGETVYLEDTLFNPCECGRNYSGTGQELAPVEQWEPEDVYDTFGPRDYEEDW